MKTVRDLLDDKGRQVWSIHPGATVLEALQMMSDRNVGAVLVMEADQLRGVFSERDYARKVVLKGRASRDTPVAQIMTGEVHCVTLEQTVKGCMETMTDKRVRHLPVLDGDGRVSGLVSIGDVVKSIISEQEFWIRQLENYIAGG